MLRHTRRFCLGIAAFMFSLLTIACLAQEPIDWDRARVLRQKEVEGQELTAPEQAYLDKAKASREQRKENQRDGDRQLKRNEGEPDWRRIELLRYKEIRGTITAEELKEYYQTLAAIDPREYPTQATRLALGAGMAGDDGNPSRSPTSPVIISPQVSPVMTFDVRSEDGRSHKACYRKPAGDGPFPTIMIIHGGTKTADESVQRTQLLRNPVFTRLLQAGFAVVHTTFRSFPPDDFQDPGMANDVVAAFRAVRELPFVDQEQIAVFGGSGGGSLAFELAAKESPAAVIAGEPATILFAGMLKTSDYRLRLQMMGQPDRYLTDESRRLMKDKMSAITCPVLIIHGDIHPLRTMNHEIFIPALRKAGVEVSVKVYPLQGHGFYFGSNARQEIVEEVVADVRQFLEEHAFAPADE